MKLYATIDSKNGSRVAKKGGEELEIKIYRGNDLWETLIIKHEEDIVEPMNTYQGTSGYTMTTEYGKRLSFILDK
jgi:hypothetical protein